MRTYRALIPSCTPGRLLASILAFIGIPALAATPSFTLAATNVTMSSSNSSGSGTSSLTLTSVDGYAGTVDVGCIAPTPPAGVKIPICNYSPGPAAQPYTLAANQTATGSMYFINAIPPCNPCPVSVPRRRDRGLSQGIGLAGALLFGFSFRRRAVRGLTLTILAVAVLALLAAISACGGNSNAVTPGTYTYQITGTDINTQAEVTTSISVTVP